MILPPILLDLLLWFGPRVRIEGLVESAINALTPPAGVSESVQQQIQAIQSGILELGAGFNLLAGLSSFPIGIPSLMAGRMPMTAPLALPRSLEVEVIGQVLPLYAGLTVAGVAAGSLYQLWMARTLAPQAQLSSAPNAVLRVVLFSLLATLGLVLGGGAVVLASALAGILLPLLGLGVLFLGLILLFWLVIYLAFTPHGILRYDFGVLRSAMESMLLVRWNTLSTVLFLSASLAIYWLSGMIWVLPEASSWFALLGIMGHAFVSAVLLMSSYVFYQGRREWLLAYRAAMALGSARPRQQDEPDRS